MKIAVLTHNPKGNWGDVREQIEKGSYEKWGKSLNLILGQTVLIYISSNIRQIQYIMEVSKVYEDNIDLKLIKKLSSIQMSLLSFNKLKENGLKNGTVNYILDNNKQLFNYVKTILDNEIINKNINIKNIILYGAPGVGKTHNYQRIISMIENRIADKNIFDTITNNKNSEKVELDEDTFKTIKDDKRVEFITFHQSYSYEDFIEGFRPQENGNIELEDGIFKRLALNAINQVKERLFGPNRIYIDDKRRK